jgi:hypothetical protein
VGAQRRGDAAGVERGDRPRIEHVGDVGGARDRPPQAERQPLEGVLELAHVAGPAVRRQALERGRRQRRRRQAEPPGDAGEQRVAERRQVRQPLAQRRQPHARHVQAEVEIGAEAPHRHLAAEIPTRGGDNPRRHAERRPAPDPLERTLLEDTQQRRLEGGLQLAHLVEEDGAAAGALEAPGAARQRTREGAALVAEQLALEQRARQRGAVGVDERPRAPRRELVQGARGHALADARLAGDEHTGLEGRQRSDLPAQPAHGRAFAHQHARQRAAVVVGHASSPSDAGSRARRRTADAGA